MKNLFTWQTVLRVGGLAGAILEAVFSKPPNEYVLILCGAAMGIPKYITFGSNGKGGDSDGKPPKGGKTRDSDADA